MTDRPSSLLAVCAGHLASRCAVRSPDPKGSLPKGSPCEGQEASERELRHFVIARVASFKVPRKILLLPEIPKGATGKLQRIGLAQKLGLA